MPSSSVTKKTGEVLEEVLRTIRQEYESPYTVLCETDRNRFVEEEASLREQLKETIESESNSWRGLLCLPSPQAVRRLKEAEELRQRVKEDINTKLRSMLTGKSNPRPKSAFDLMGARTQETIITSPRNMHCSLSEPEVSEVNVSPAVRDYTSNTEAINSSLEMSSKSSDRRRDSSSRPHRRSPPPPPLLPLPNISCPLSEPEVSPLETSSDSSDGIRDSASRRRRSPPPPRRMSQSGHSRLLSDASSNSGSDTPRRAHSVRRPAPPPPQSPRQSRTPCSPTNVSFPSSGPFPPDPAVISSISRLAQDMNTLASSIVTESLPRQAKGRQRPRGSDYVSKTNCVDISGSNVDGLTLNNGATNCSGAVIHKTAMPPQHAAQI